MKAFFSGTSKDDSYYDILSIKNDMGPYILNFV